MFLSLFLMDDLGAIFPKKGVLLEQKFEQNCIFVVTNPYMNGFSTGKKQKVLYRILPSCR